MRRKAARRAEPSAPAGVGEHPARSRDCRRRYRRSRGALTRDRPGSGAPRPRPGDDRALRVAPRPRGDELAHPRVPLHPAAGPWHPPQPGARAPSWPTSAPWPGCCGPASGPRLRLAVRRPRVVVIVGGYASFPAGVAARADPGAAGLHDDRRRARSGQRAARTLRRGQRRGLPRDRPAAGAM